MEPQVPCGLTWLQLVQAQFYPPRERIGRSGDLDCVGFIPVDLRACR
jgi:hypothetical protein